jgi:hypothetical protein
MEKIICGSSAQGAIESKKLIASGLILKTVWDFECWDRRGNMKWLESDRPNMIVTQGLNHILDSCIDADTQITAWYVIPVETNTDAALAMTYAVPVFTESQAYTEANRQAYDPAAASGGVMTNSASKATFTINDTKTLYGGALVGGGAAASTKGDTAGGGKLFCYSKFSAGKSVESGDTFKITITITIANS